MKNKASKRTLIIQLAAVVVLVVIAYIMTIIGRGHTVYLDNKKLEYNGQTYDTPYKVVVYQDGEQIAKLYDRERGSTTCIGQKLTLTLEITQQKGGSETTEVYTLSLPRNMDGIIINLPAYLAGLCSAHGLYASNKEEPLWLFWPDSSPKRYLGILKSSALCRTAAAIQSRSAICASALRRS